ncbi:unnamed protein product [Oncorhynchus mykiss]|uniref:Uncharacterized protein n=1 Tax=Oncorhynchus mykiss TaxID=8022 RepID=A0A060ZJM8_ONCMY|nr:unnamed protein product [Oncorhynchus mykiss]
MAPPGVRAPVVRPSRHPAQPGLCVFKLQAYWITTTTGPLQAEEEAEEMDTGGLELSPQAAIQMHTESEAVVPTHTDLEPGAKQLWSPSPMHNDPETQLQPVPMPTNAEPEPVQATNTVCENALEDRQPQQATSDQQPGKSIFCLTGLFVSTHRGKLCIMVTKVSHVFVFLYPP